MRGLSNKTKRGASIPSQQCQSLFGADADFGKKKKEEGDQQQLSSCTILFRLPWQFLNGAQQLGIDWCWRACGARNISPHTTDKTKRLRTTGHHAKVGLLYQCGQVTCHFSLGSEMNLGELKCWRMKISSRVRVGKYRHAVVKGYATAQGRCRQGCAWCLRHQYSHPAVGNGALQS